MDSDSIANAFSPEVQKSFLHAVLSSIGDQLDIIDHEFRLLWTSVPPPDVDFCGRPCYEIYHNRSAPCQNCPVEAVFHSGTAAVTEKKVELPHVRQRWGEVRIYPVKDQRGRITHALKIRFDITVDKIRRDRHKDYISTLEKSLQLLTQQQVNGNSDSYESRQLTGRESEVLRLLAQGFTNNEIANILTLSRHTVKSHVVHIFTKLDVNDRAQAAVQATRLRLI